MPKTIFHHTTRRAPFNTSSTKERLTPLSLMEQTLALAMAAQRFRILIDDEVVPDPVFTLRPAGGIQARLEKRSVSSVSLYT
jgi:hypothetical protein